MYITLDFHDSDGAIVRGGGDVGLVIWREKNNTVEIYWGEYTELAETGNIKREV